MPLYFKARTPYIYSSRNIILRIVYTLIACLATLSAKAQCTTPSSQTIPDDGILTIDFYVSGLVDSDLASATQGICGVEIDFMHEYLGDLTISLISPAGTIVQLVGPPTTSTTPTNLSRWNVQFVPCATSAAPDAGFADIWSNLQAWQVSTPYSGSYHPNSGCLEDFNTGSANGIWQVVFEDHDVLQIGSVAKVTLIFCNPAGLSCVECAPNGGVINPSAMLLCEGENIQSSDVTIDFGSNNPTPALYSYTYILHTGNIIVKSDIALSQVATPGNFSLCGLSYLTSDAAAVNALLSAGNYDLLVQAINNAEICASLSSPCVSVNVLAIPDTTVMDVILCKDDSYVFKGQLFSTPGVYHVVVDGLGQCDSVFRLNITASNLLAVIATPDSISCGSGGVLLDGSLSQGSGSISYEWSTASGILNGNLTNSQVTALVPGIYTLTVRDGICEDSKDVVVHGDLSYPQIFVQGGVITCAKPIIKVHPVVIPSNVTYAWTGPGGFTSSMQDINVSIPGRYFLRITSTAGCEVFTYIDINANTDPPDVTISLFDKVCGLGIGVIGTSITNSIYEWEGPEMGLPASQVIQISSGGTYLLTVTDPATGCSGSASYLFDDDFNIPPIIVVGMDSIRCSQDVSLFVNPTDIAGVPHWAGPNGFITTGFNVSLSQPGTYVISVSSSNGCRNSQTLELFASSSYPDFTITNDTISCIDNLATIGITFAGADIYNWPDLQAPESANSFVQVTIPGAYFVIAKDTNSGCEIKAIANAFSDLTLPQYNYSTDTLSCNQPIGTLSFIPLAGQQYASVQWQYPDMTIVNNSSITVNEIGEYLLTVVGINGCIGSSLVEVEADTVVPVFFLEPDVLGCDRQGVIRNIRVDTLIGIFWTGPNGFSSSELEPIVSDTGIYTASGFSANGCPKEVSAHVTGDFSMPSSLISLEELTCLDPFAEFVAHSTDSIIAYEWRDESGVIIGTDSVVIISSPGSYTLRLEGINHCINIDTLVVGAAEYPTVSVMSDTLKCDMDSVLLIASSNVMDPVFAWLDQNGDTLSTNKDLLAFHMGPFIISVTAPNGCEIKDTITIAIDTLAAFASIDLIGEVRCQNHDFILDGSASMPSSIEFLWTTSGGMILSDNKLSMIDARDTGIYILTVRNPVNGCTDTDSIHVGEHPDAITQAVINIKRPACSGDENAEIQVTALSGGVGPFLYQLDSLASQAGNTFQGLTSGTYVLEILDAAGCIYDTTVIIEPTNPYTVDAGPDQEIFIGESADLSGISDILPIEIFSQDWDSMGVILCQDCPASIVRPLTTSTYRFTVTSVTGCVINDDVIIYVIEKGKFYIPNIFSPNGDNVNEEIRFYPTPGIEKVLDWTIFDRWGNAVFGKRDFIPDDPSVFWDGTAQGSEKLNPGVFPYILEVELLNGNREVHHGTITLVR